MNNYSNCSRLTLLEPPLPDFCSRQLDLELRYDDRLLRDHVDVLTLTAPHVGNQGTMTVLLLQDYCFNP